MRAHALLAAVLLALAGPARAAETTVERYLELRDGSVLKLPVVDEAWKVQLLRADGRIEEAAVRLSELQRLSLAPDRVFEKKRAILSLVQKLGADEFSERETAHQDLLKMGPKIRPDLEAVKDLYADVEIQSRLKEILAQWPADKKEPQPGLPFDVLGGKETLWGDAGDAGIPVRVDGKTYRLARKDVLAMTVKPPDAAFFNLPQGGGGFRRLGPNDYPPGCVEEGFETAPDGRRLKVGENVERLFLGKGFLLSTSVKTSYVSVNDYVVNGKTKGLSCATHQPLFQGEVTITFVKPGHENMPAGVNYFGLWIAYVEVNGTAIHAYDLQGRELGRVATQRREHDFLGVYSPVPIHKIKVVPNLQIDPDYTIDDLIFSPPQTPDLAHPEKCAVQLAGGERILCRDVSFTPDGVRLHGLPAGLPDRTAPLADVTRVTAPEKKEKPALPGVFVELQDGSVVFGAKPKDKGPPAFRKPDVLKDPGQVVGLWSSKNPRQFWPAKAATPGMAKVVNKTLTWEAVANVKLEEEAVRWSPPGPEGTDTLSVSYYEMMPLLLKAPPGEKPGSWHVRTAQGEDLVLSADELPQITGKVSQGVTTTWDGKELKLAADEIVAVYRVPKK